METNDTKFRDLLRDTAVLSKLEDEKEKNFQYITGQINARKRRRIFTRVALSCAAAVAVALAFTFSFENSAGAEDELDALDSPLLITESGEKIALSDQNSYKLELGSQSNGALYSDLSNSNSIANKSSKSVTSSNTKEKDELSGQNVKTVNRNTVVIPRGFTYDIEFDDGSQAHLNSGSYIEFPKSFENRQVRVVALTGEGYFKVAKSEKPFIVKVGELHIKVYGTEFNVNTNKDGRVEALLVSGSVGVKPAGAQEEILLKPNELLVYDVNTGSSTVKEVIVDDYLAWMRGDFTCSSQPLFHLIDEISAFYGIAINKDASLANQLITISLSRQLGYRQIMEILSQAFGLEFNKVDSQTFICKQTN